MPFGIRPICSACKTSVSPMWRKDEVGLIMCNSCYINHLNVTSREDTISVISDNDSVNSGSNNGLRTAIVAAKQNDPLQGTNRDTVYTNNSNVRKSSRIKPSSKSKSQQSKSNPGKGKNRRFIFKKTPPIKSHPSFATVVTSDSLFYQGFYYQVGDIVSLVDHSGDIYYAQIYSLLQDQYCEKSAVITWLLPTTASDPNKFDPSTYIIGPTEELPRKLEYMEFVCHAPADYFKPKYVSIPGLHKEPLQTGFIWTSIGPRACKAPTIDEIFGTNIENLTLMTENLMSNPGLS